MTEGERNLLIAVAEAVIALGTGSPDEILTKVSAVSRLKDALPPKSHWLGDISNLGTENQAASRDHENQPIVKRQTQE